MVIGQSVSWQERRTIFREDARNHPFGNRYWSIFKHWDANQNRIRAIGNQLSANYGLNWTPVNFLPMVGVPCNPTTGISHSGILPAYWKFVHYACGLGVHVILAPRYEIPSEEGKNAVKVFANLESILLDHVDTGKAAAGLLFYDTNCLFEGDTVLFIRTGGNGAEIRGCSIREIKK